LNDKQKFYEKKHMIGDPVIKTQLITLVPENIDVSMPHRIY